jgi:hypothetical protein
MAGIDARIIVFAREGVEAASGRNPSKEGGLAHKPSTPVPRADNHLTPQTPQRAAGSGQIEKNSKGGNKNRRVRKNRQARIRNNEARCPDQADFAGIVNISSISHPLKSLVP